MNNQQIIQSESGQRIRLGPYVGSGQIAAVYKGTVEGSGDIVAVKIPVSDTISINTEYDLLKKLEELLKKPKYSCTVPWVEKGQDAQGRNVLIMEYIDDKWLLGGCLYQIQDDILKREEIALQAAAQYVDLLEALHSISYTCQDRKTTDLRWLAVDQGFPMTDRLVVLDWNAVTKDSKDFAGDIALFGENWYQLITGKVSPLRLDPLKDAFWRDGKVSFGMRRLLSQVLSPAPGEQIKTAREAGQKIQELLQYYKRDAGDLYKEGHRLLIEVKNNDAQIKEFLGHGRPASELDKLNLFDPEKEWKALICLDIANLKGHSGTKERNECLKLVIEQGQRLVEYAEHFIGIDDYKQGQNAVRWAERVTSQVGNAAFQLIVARRKILVNAGQTALEDELFHLRDMWVGLLDWIKKLEENISNQAGSENWQNLQNELSKTLTALERGKGTSQRTVRLLDNLKYEVEWHTMLAKIEECESAGRYQEALDVLASSPAPTLAEDWFRKAISNHLPSGADLKDKLKEKADWKKRLDAWDEEIKAFKVIGRPDYIDYLLHLRLKDIRLHIGEEEAENAQKWLEGLQQFYFCVHGNDLEQLCYVAISLWKDTPEVWSKATRLEIAKHLNMLFRRANDYSAMNIPAYNQESLRILNCLREIRAELQSK